MAVTAAGIVMYRLFSDQIAGRLVFVAPAILLVAGLFVLHARLSSRPGRTLGLDRDSLRP